MRASTFARKPPGKRGVNKATIDQPQEEFITDKSSTAENKRGSTKQTAEPAVSKPQRGTPSRK